MMSSCIQASYPVLYPLLVFTIRFCYFVPEMIRIPGMKFPLFPSIVVPFFFGCSGDVKSTLVLSGPAQGTTYNITYLAGAYANYRKEIDSIFSVIDQSLSTYQPTSIISRFNLNDKVEADTHFINVFNRSKTIYETTNGFFDPTVAPLVNAYGFGFQKKKMVTQSLIDSLKKIIGFNHVWLEGTRLVKRFPETVLDFNAIAPGYTVDVLADFLDSKGIDHYLIELGGEVRSKGKKQDGSAWTLGIEKPDEYPAEAVRLHTRILLSNHALATSGNYKNFYRENGKKYSHIINPFTGYPAGNSLLSATVIAPDCITADAYATAFMVMGVEKAKQFLVKNKHLNLSAFFIFDRKGTTQTYYSPNFPAPQK